MSEGWIRELSEEECRDYLTLVRIGRIAFAGPERIELFPVNAVSDGTTIFVRTEPGTLLAEAVAAGPLDVAFETDYFEELYQQGWSVTVRGHAQVASKEQIALLDGSSPRPWAPGDRDLVIAVFIERLDGRKVRHG